MGRLILITGGARSGKSALAEKLARDFPTVCYLATSIPFDDEMKDRVRSHRLRRPPHWRTQEAWQGVSEVLEHIGEPCCLLDCITLMVSNLLMDHPIDWDEPEIEQIEQAQKDILKEMDMLIEAVELSDLTLICVTNEVGLGIVPAFPFGRAYRDIAGRANQKLAAAADEVYLCVSGIPVKLKG